MIFGDESKFAIDCSVVEIVDEWVFGKFLVIINNYTLGDFDDESVDLNGCVNWIKDFLERPKNRYEAGLFEMKSDELYKVIGAPVLVHENPDRLLQEKYQDTYSRFHISHLGMSSFEFVVFLLLKNENGVERCVWRVRDGNILDFTLPPDTIENVLIEFVKNFKQLIQGAKGNK